MGILGQGFPWSRLNEFRDGGLAVSFNRSFSFICCPLVAYDKTVVTIRDLAEEGY